ncbi:MAG TPA: SH3 domain-containing protein [Chloroflexi bacterium]|nr:SH3 domain-containing protein [Chloroflexota bacterium]
MRESLQFDSTLPAIEEHPAHRLRLGWRILITLILLLLVMVLGMLLQSPRAASAAPASRPSAQSSADRLVLAFYYTWFDETTWSYDKLSDLPAESYISRDRAVMGRHIEQAQSAGIDALVVAWYGPNGAGNQTEPNLAALLDEAAARGFKIAALFETDSPFLGSVEATTGALQHLLSVHANHPAYLRVDGRPVVFFWRPGLYGVETWAAIRNQVDPNHGAFWVSEGVDTSLLAIFDGHHLYSNTWNPPSDLLATNRKFAARTDAAGGLWVATVMPGYNDVKIRPGSGFAQDREGGAYYARSWQAAIDSGADWVIINSFNEWPEGSYIEPSVAFGRQYLDLTASWSSQFKAASAPVASAPAAEIAPDAPTAIVRTPVLNLRAGPGVEFDLLGYVVEGNRLPIIGRNAAMTWWQVEAVGAQAWVFGELVEAAGPVDQTPIAATPATGDEPAPIETSADEPGFRLTIGDQVYILRQVRTTTP